MVNYLTVLNSIKEAYINYIYGYWWRPIIFLILSYYFPIWLLIESFSYFLLNDQYFDRIYSKAVIIIGFYTFDDSFVELLLPLVLSAYLIQSSISKDTFGARVERVQRKLVTYYILLLPTALAFYFDFQWLFSFLLLVSQDIVVLNLISNRENLNLDFIDIGEKFWCTGIQKEKRDKFIKWLRNKVHNVKDFKDFKDLKNSLYENYLLVKGYCYKNFKNVKDVENLKKVE